MPVAYGIHAGCLCAIELLKVINKTWALYSYMLFSLTDFVFRPICAAVFPHLINAATNIFTYCFVNWIEFDRGCIVILFTKEATGIRGRMIIVRYEKMSISILNMVRDSYNQNWFSSMCTAVGTQQYHTLEMCSFSIFYFYHFDTNLYSRKIDFRFICDTIRVDCRVWI